MTPASEPTSPSPLTRLLDSPLLGFLPWIAMSQLIGDGRFVLACVVALSLSVLFVLTDLVRGRSLKLLGALDVGFFAAFLVIGLCVSTGTLHWLERWFNELSNIVLVVVVVASLVCRAPFTLPYAREEVPRERWDDPLFLRVNYIVTGAWAVAFVVAAAAGLYGDAVLRNDNNLWTAWLIQALAQVAAAEFTHWYPRYARIRQLHELGDHSQPWVPVSAVLASVAGYLLLAGALAMALTADPPAVDVAVIAVGAIASFAFRVRATRTPHCRAASGR